MKIGIIREGKTPPDSRVPLSPEACLRAIKKGVEIKVQPSPGRCFNDKDFAEKGIELTEDLNDCEVLMGVKEVPISQLIADKTYFFFSHTIKAQPYNRKLLLAILEKNIQLIDYEVIKNDKGARVIAFGRFAGMVGAHNALWTYAKRKGNFSLPRMNSLDDYEAAKSVYKQTKFPAIKIVLTGTGRVGNGAAEVLLDMGIKKVSSEDFLLATFDYPVFCQLECADYAQTRNKTPFDKNEFYTFPERYKSQFEPYTMVSDIMINGIYWDSKAPAFFTKEEMRQKDFTIEVIADVTCDIAPEASIPSTLYASTIAEPVFGYDPITEKAVAPFGENVIDVMSIDNLPNEMPKDASMSFGNTFVEVVLDELLKGDDSEMIRKATVTKNGKLGEHFQYLTDYVKGV